MKNKEWMPTKKEEVDSIMNSIYLCIGMDRPHNHYEILEFIYEDVNSAADAENWSEGDVAIAFRRWIERENNPLDRGVLTQLMNLLEENKVIDYDM